MHFKGKEGNFIAASVYCPDDDGPAVTGTLESLVQHCNTKQLPLIVGADSNAHSHLWGPDQNSRGDAFEDLISQNDLTVLIDGLDPTWSQGVTEDRG